MATLGATYMGLIDLMRTEGADANAEVVEVLSKISPVANNAITLECNDGTQHKHSIRTGLPSVTWGRLYQGIPQSKSGRTQVIDTTGFVEGLSTVDQRLLDIAKNPAAVRDQEARAFQEAMAQEMETGFFYHDVVTTPEKFKGLAARYNSLTGSAVSRQVVSAGGSGSDNTSIWFVTWAENATALLHPSGIPGGLVAAGHGNAAHPRRSNNPYYVKEELFRWHVGVAVRDYRYNARICNIDHQPRGRHGRPLQVHAPGGLPLQGTYASAFRNKDGSLNASRRRPHGHLHEPHGGRSARRRKHQRLAQQRPSARHDGARRPRCAVLPRHSRSRSRTLSEHRSHVSAKPEPKE
jgi:hypothetical protein